LNFILIRHGETQHNLERKAIGINPVGLNVRGRLQAMRVAEALVALAPDALYTSPLPRALETATTISQRLGLELIIRDELKEANIGLLDGLTQDDMHQQYPDFMETWSTDPSTTVMPRGESIPSRRSESFILVIAWQLLATASPYLALCVNFWVCLWLTFVNYG
jgi:broad specificity phosphatase PhoE